MSHFWLFLIIASYNVQFWGDEKDNVLRIESLYLAIVKKKSLFYFYSVAETGFYRFLCEYVLNVIYFCDQICIFSIITPVFRVTWPSEIIIICCSRNISDYYRCWKQLIFLWKLWCISGFTDEQKGQKISMYLKSKCFVTLWMSLLSLLMGVKRLAWVLSPCGPSEGCFDLDPICWMRGTLPVSCPWYLL